MNHVNTIPTFKGWDTGDDKTQNKYLNIFKFQLNYL
jgi:hypothetical protein